MHVFILYRYLPFLLIECVVSTLSTKRTQDKVVYACMRVGFRIIFPYGWEFCLRLVGFFLCFYRAILLLVRVVYSTSHSVLNVMVCGFDFVFAATACCGSGNEPPAEKAKRGCCDSNSIIIRHRRRRKKNKKKRRFFTCLFAIYIYVCCR